MPVHDEVLRTAQRLCRDRKEWTFGIDEVVRALPHLNPSSVRTHVGSRCCINAPKHHLHRWAYFRRVGRGVYEVLPERREAPPPREIRETGASYRPAEPLGEVVHAIVRRSGRWYVGETVEIAVVTQGRTLDEVVANLEEAIGLHFEGENLTEFGFARYPRLSVTFEKTIRPDAEA